MRKVKINNQEHIVDALLDNYRIEQKPSSNVDYFGDNGIDVFIQFKNGKSYLYKGVLKEHIEQMYQAESIGKFISLVSKIYTYVPIEQRLVNVVPVAAAQ